MTWNRLVYIFDKLLYLGYLIPISIYNQYKYQKSKRKGHFSLINDKDV